MAREFFSQMWQRSKGNAFLLCIAEQCNRVSAFSATAQRNFLNIFHAIHDISRYKLWSF